MLKRPLKLLAFYFIIYGLIGIMIAVSEGLFDYRSYGDFFLRTSLLNIVIAFFTVPLFALYSLLSSVVTLTTFSAQLWEVHLTLLLFLAISFIGISKHNKIILLLAALLPLTTTAWELFF